MSVARRTAAALTIGLLALTSACSSAGHLQSSGGNNASATTGATSNAAVATPTAGAGSDARYCAAMKVSDAQVLVKPTLAAAQTGGSESCTFVLPAQSLGGDNLTVNVTPGDTDKSAYNEIVSGAVSGPQHTLAGIAGGVWEQPTSGSVPFVAAHQGSTTCVVQPPSDASSLTIPQTGSGPVAQVSTADAAAFAAKMAVLCTDAFSVGD